MSVIKIYLVSFVIIILFSGCSHLVFLSYFEQNEQGNWKNLSKQESHVYAYGYNCNTFSIKMRKIDRGTWSLTGPPLIPFLPISYFMRSSSHNLYIDIAVTNITDSIEIKFPEIAIRIDSSDVLEMPADSFLVQNDFKRIEKEGLYHWDFYVGGALNYMYKFKINGYPNKSIDIIFLNKYLGNNVPTINYIRQDNVTYHPWVIPSD
jgi:hypothetical protein